jgi:hypothetical protein
VNLGADVAVGHLDDTDEVKFVGTDEEGRVGRV